MFERKLNLVVINWISIVPFSLIIGVRHHL